MQKIIDAAKQYIQTVFEGDFSGHDAFHSLRVYALAVKLAELQQANVFEVALAALLHDVDDRKLSPDTTQSKQNAVRFMQEHQLDEGTIRRVKTMIEEVSFRGTDSVIPSTREGMCVQDADRLDAIGAIGIARAFAYGGSHHRKLYDPAVPPCLNMDAEAYYGHESTTLNHFYEKLFLLKDMLCTPAARRIAEKRERCMRDFVEEFLLEWQGEH